MEPEVTNLKITGNASIMSFRNITTGKKKEG